MYPCQGRTRSVSVPYHLRIYRKRTDTEQIRTGYGDVTEIAWRLHGDAMELILFSKSEVSVIYIIFAITRCDL